MPQDLIERTAPDDVDSLTRWGAEMLRALASLQSRWDVYARAAQPHISNRTFETSGEGALTSGLIGVLFPQRGADEHDPLLDTLATAGEVQRTLRPLLQHVGQLRVEIERALEETKPTRTRLFGAKRGPGHGLAGPNRLLELKDWGEKTGYWADLLQQVQSQANVADGNPSAMSDVVLLDAWRALAPLVGAAPPKVRTLLRADDVSLLSSVLARGEDLLGARERLAAAVRNIFEQVQDQMVHRQLVDMPITALRDAAKHLRVSQLEGAGIATVQDVLDHSRELGHLVGIGPQTARTALETAYAIRRAVKDDLKLRIDLDETNSLLTHLVRSLRGILVFDERMELHREALEQLVEALRPLESGLARRERLTLFHRQSPRRGSDVVRHLEERADWVRSTGLEALLHDAAQEQSVSAAEAWDDFKRRSPVYYGLLGEVVGFEFDVDAVQGHLPAEIVAAVERQGLDTSLLKPSLRSSLRGYQSFGARYALVQRKVLLGDEMGLGKTIQALAAMSHLAANGSRHFVVVCPPAVLVNWIKEVRKHSDLEPHRLHGTPHDRERALRRWSAHGGVAITSYSLVSKLFLAEHAPAMVVVDEAHFVKNPDTQRAAAVRELVDVSERALYLTGTPLENRVEEFTNLVSQLQPDVVNHIDPASMVVGARKFREAVAPVYLRRNSNDVLSELPDLVETEEWSDFSPREHDAYLDALAEHDFQGMRRIAVTADPAGSQKLERLEELVEEAASNKRNVLVFSYYKDVLEQVRQRLGARVVGVITGSTSPDERQRLVDAFSDSGHPGVLVSQIVAGGVGLNLQAASVVVLCEPQVKPSLESQAIKRAHRMGQVQSVQVHRLLTTDSVDERMLEILDTKSRLFEQFAAESDVAQASPEATDKTESDVIKQVMAQEQKRHAADLRARMGGAAPAALADSSPPQVSEPGALTPSADTKHGEQKSGITKPRIVSETTSSRKSAARPTTPRPVAGSRGDENRARRPSPKVHVCNSCGRPIDFNGHCGCS